VAGSGLLHSLVQQRRAALRQPVALPTPGWTSSWTRPHDPSTRPSEAIYAQVEQRIVDLAPWVFLHWRPQAEATRANIKGYTRLPGALGNKSTGGLKYLWRE